MSKPRPYFHDRLVLLLLTINTFLALACIGLSLLSLSGSGAIISQYRANLGLDGYRAGSALDILSFGIFAGMIYVSQLALSMKLYHIRKNASLAVLMLSLVLLVFTLIVCNALLELR